LKSSIKPSSSTLKVFPSNSTVGIPSNLLYKISL
jgi:hypothetical protein